MTTTLRAGAWATPGRRAMNARANAAPMVQERMTASYITVRYNSGMRIVLAGVLAALLAPQEPQPVVQKADRFSAIMTAGPFTPQPTSLEIGVDRWATDVTRMRLFELFHAGGQSALLEAVK